MSLTPPEGTLASLLDAVFAASPPGLAHLTDEQADKALEWLLGLGYVYLWQVPGPVWERAIARAKGAELRLG